MVLNRDRQSTDATIISSAECRWSRPQKQWHWHTRQLPEAPEHDRRT